MGKNRALSAWLQSAALAWGIPLHGIDWQTALRGPLRLWRGLSGRFSRAEARGER